MSENIQNIDVNQIPGVAEALQNMRGDDPLTPIKQKIMDITKSGQVNNVYREDGMEFRCVVLNKETKIATAQVVGDDGIGQQIYDPKEDLIYWICLIHGRQVGFEQVGVDNLNQMITSPRMDFINAVRPEDRNYMINWLTAFNSSETIFMDDKRIESFKAIEQKILALFGSTVSPAATFISNLASRSENPLSLIPSWDQAELFKGDESKEFSFGLDVEVGAKDFVKFNNTRLVYWFKGTVLDNDGKEVEDGTVHQATRHLNHDLIPELTSNTKANFMITETMNDEIQAVLEIVENGLNGNIENVKLYRNEKFEIPQY